MEGGLDEADTGGFALTGAFEHGLHQLAAYAMVLYFRVNRDRTDTVDDGALVEAVAAENAAFALGYDAVEAGRGEHRIDGTESGFRVGEITRKIVRGVNGSKGAVADVTTDGNVLWSSWANKDLGVGTRRHIDVLVWGGTKYSRANAAGAGRLAAPLKSSQISMLRSVVCAS